MNDLMCEGRVALVTGAGRGLGKEYALMLAEQGAKVIVNDLGGERDGTGADLSPAREVVEEIRAAGGEAEVNGGDVSDFTAAKEMIDQAVDTFGRLDIVVNNAGILRDRMMANMSEEEWDLVIRVHLKGTYAPAHHAAAYWRTLAKAGEQLQARLINTTSASGIYGNVGQANYGAAKAGIASFTYITSLELQRYGVTVNAIAPGAITRLTAGISMGDLSEEMQAAGSPRWVAPLCTWLASEQSAGVTGRVFEATGQGLAVAEGWHRGPSGPATDDPHAVDEIIRKCLETARPPAGMDGNDLPTSGN